MKNFEKTLRSLLSLGLRPLQGFGAFKLALMQQDIAYHYSTDSIDSKRKNPYIFQEFNHGFQPIPSQFVTQQTEICSVTS
jgi:hypothetical protein